jgi:hypothetical protein
MKSNRRMKEKNTRLTKGQKLPKSCWAGNKRKELEKLKEEEVF